MTGWLYLKVLGSHACAAVHILILQPPNCGERGFLDGGRGRLAADLAGGFAIQLRITIRLRAFHARHVQHEPSLQDLELCDSLRTFWRQAKNTGEFIAPCPDKAACRSVNERICDIEHTEHSRGVDALLLQCALCFTRRLSGRLAACDFALRTRFLSHAGERTDRARETIDECGHPFMDTTCGTVG